MIDPPENGQSAPGDDGDGSQPSSRKRVRIAHNRPNFDESPQPETRTRSTPISKSIDTAADGAAPAQESQRQAGEPATSSRSGEAGPRSAPVIIRPEVHQGSHPGDKFIRYGRTAGPFKRKGRDVYAASLEANAPRSKWGQIFDRFKRVTIGRPISTEHSIHERLSNVKALAVLASDALSSVAYATEEILRILILAGVGALSTAMPVAVAVILLMIIVVASYRQTIAAYPRGGGTYIVAKDNLGTLPGLTAAASILIGYVLTVAVSVAAGIAAMYSLFPPLREYRVEICIGVVLLITVANLRGVREAGNIFAVPTYLFIVGMFGLIGYGLLRLFFGVGGPMTYVPPEETFHAGTEALGLVLLLRAFTQGSAALTGVEAIADGVPAFQPPEARNARMTLFYMGAIAILMFGGITYLATALHVLPSEQETVVSQIARTVFPPIFGANPLHFFIQIVTALILVLAANTAFADFPRLSYFMARDKFMPHQYAFRGDRLAFSWGIVTLAVVACLLIIAFRGETSSLIPLYAVAVMGAFSFSQSGMVARWWRLRPTGWARNLVMNGIGAIVTTTVFIVATVTKLELGTWLVIVLIPLLILIFLAINRHYQRVSHAVSQIEGRVAAEFKHTWLVPVARLDSVTKTALGYATSLSDNVTAVHIVEGEEEDEAQNFHDAWQKFMPDNRVPLVIIESPYRSLMGPLLSYIDALDRQNPDDTVTIVVSEFLPSKPWEYLLHNQSALRLKAALLFRPNTVVVNVPYRLSNRSIETDKQVMRRQPWRAILMTVALLLAAYFLFFR